MWMTVLALASCALVTQKEFDQRLDLDGDGHAAVAYSGDDCDDKNADIHPGVPERCDGVDWDCDGLVDCEDADCDTMLVCSETSCTNREDDDDDGFTDCEDDDCWGDKCFGPTEAWLTRSTLFYMVEADQSVDLTGCASPSTCDAHLRFGSVPRAVGRLRFPLSAQRDRWSTCRWSATSVSFADRTFECTTYPGGGVGAVGATTSSLTRGDITIDEDCVIQSPYFLPWTLTLDPKRARATTPDGLPWYQGTFTYNLSNTQTGSTAINRCVGPTNSTIRKRSPYLVVSDAVLELPPRFRNGR